MSGFWEQNKGTFKSAGVAGLKGAAIGGKKLASASYKAGKKAYNNRDKNNTGRNRQNRRNNRGKDDDDDYDEEDDYSPSPPRHSTSSRRSYGQLPPPANYGYPPQGGYQPQYPQQPQLLYGQYPPPAQGYPQQLPVAGYPPPPQHQPLLQQPYQQPYLQQPDPYLQQQQPPLPALYQQPYQQPGLYPPQPYLPLAPEQQPLYPPAQQQPALYPQPPPQSHQPTLYPPPQQQQLYPPQQQYQSPAPAPAPLPLLALFPKPPQRNVAAHLPPQVEPGITMENNETPALLPLPQLLPLPTSGYPPQPYAADPYAQQPPSAASPYGAPAAPSPAPSPAALPPRMAQPIPGPPDRLLYPTPGPPPIAQDEAPRSQYGNFGVPSPDSEEDVTPKAPLPDPKQFLPPPIHRGRGVTATAEPPKKPLASAGGLPKPTLPSRGSAPPSALAAGEEEVESENEEAEEPAAPKKNWMDASNVGPPPPRPPTAKVNAPPPTRRVGPGVKPATGGIPPLPSRNSAASAPPAVEAAEDEEGGEEEVLSEPPKKNWMDTSNVGPPPPKTFRAPVVEQKRPAPSRIMTASPSLGAPPAPPRPTPGSPAVGADEESDLPPKRNWMDTSNVGPPPPKTYRPPVVEQKKPPMAPPRDTGSPLGTVLEKPDVDEKTKLTPMEVQLAKFGPPPKMIKKPVSERFKNTEYDDLSSEPFGHIKKDTQPPVEEEEPVEAPKVLNKLAPPKPIKKNPLLSKWTSKEQSTEEKKTETLVPPELKKKSSVGSVKTNTSLGSGNNNDDEFVNSLRGNLKKTNVDFSKFEKKQEETHVSPPDSPLSNGSHIPIIKPKPPVILRKPSAASSVESSEAVRPLRKEMGVPLPGLVGLKKPLRSVAPMPMLDDENMGEEEIAPPVVTKKKPAPPPVKPKLKPEIAKPAPPPIKPRHSSLTSIDSEESRPSLPARRQAPVEHKIIAPRLPTRKVSLDEDEDAKPNLPVRRRIPTSDSEDEDSEEETQIQSVEPNRPNLPSRASSRSAKPDPPSVLSRPRLASPPLAPPSRHSAKQAAPEIDLQIASGWWAKEELNELPQDLQGLSYSTSFGYSSNENFRIYAFRLKDLSTLKLRFTWSRSSTDPLKSYNFEQKFIPAPQPTTLKQIVGSHEKFGDYIASWCENKEGTTVGSGECWDLAQQALQKGCGKHAFVSDGLNHGYMMLLVKGHAGGAEFVPSLITDDVKRGDILQFKSCTVKYPNSTVTYGAPDHTAVVLDVRSNELEIIHQNVNGVKKVQKGEIDLSRLVDGEIRVFRPMDADWIGELVASWP